VGAGTTTGSTGTGSSDSYTPINYATTSNAKSSLAGLFNYNGLNTSLMNLSNAAAALGSTAAGNSAGAQLSPAANTVAASQSASASTSQVVEVVAAHVDGLRVAQAQGSSGVATGEGSNDMAVWGQAFGGKAQQSLRDNVSGYRSTYNGLLLGADKMVHQDWRVGGLLSYANNSVTQSDDNTGSSAHVNSYGLMGYAGYSNERWYLDLTAGAVKHRYSTVRAIDFRDFSGTANGSFNGVQYVTAVQGGMPIKLDSLWQRTTLTPIAKLSYSTLRQNGYTESGGNGAALIVNAVNSNSLKSELGAKIERVFTTSYGEVAPAVQLGWRHEFHDNALQTVSSFAADSSGATSFTTTGSTPLRDTGVLALSTTLTRSDNLTLTARYTLETARGYNAQTADLRLRYQF
jgi:outer membrane autotransporter protein